MSGSSHFLAEEKDRSKVVDILARLEKNEKEAREIQEHLYEDELDSDEEHEHDETAADVRANITAEQIEAASTDTLLAMLTPKERQTFLEAVKNPQSTASLMQRLDRKAERHARTETASSTPQGVLVASQSASEGIPQQLNVRREWQSIPWFEKPETIPPFLGRPSEQLTAFIHLLERGLSAERLGSPSVDLVYNLCAVLMAYTYTLRKMDIVSLSELTSEHKTVEGQSLASSSPVSFRDPASKFEPQRWQQDDDEEPPPLEPDAPISYRPGRTPASSATESNASTMDDKLATAEQAFDKLSSLVPFLFAPLAPFSTNVIAGAHSDHSKLVLSSLADSSMWLLSRLSLESDVGHGGVDAISLQLLQDLAKIMTRDPLVPTFAQVHQVEPKYRIASKLASLSPQQAFSAAQMPLLLNAVADIHSFLNHLPSTLTAPSSISSITRIKSKQIKLAQRKLCFYLCSVIKGDHIQMPRASSTLTAQLQDSIQDLRNCIHASNQADKIATAVNLIDKKAAPTPMILSIN